MHERIAFKSVREICNGETINRKWDVMSNGSGQKNRMFGKRNLPKLGRYGEYCHFFLRKDAWLAIRRLKNWPERGSKTRFAEALGICREYARLIVDQLVGCSAEVMYRIIRLVGYRENDCWCHLFTDRTGDPLPSNHPIYSDAKYDGVLPYEKYSSSAELRKGDYNVETK